MESFLRTKWTRKELEIVLSNKNEKKSLEEIAYTINKSVDELEVLLVVVSMSKEYHFKKDGIEAPIDTIINSVIEANKCSVVEVSKTRTILPSSKHLIN